MRSSASGRRAMLAFASSGLLVVLFGTKQIHAFTVSSAGVPVRPGSAPSTGRIIRRRRRRQEQRKEQDRSSFDDDKIKLLPASIVEELTVGATTIGAASNAANGLWLSAAADALADAKDYEEVYKTVAIALTLGGGLIPASISANQQMFKALSGRKGDQPETEAELNPNNTFDPTIADMKTNAKYRQYVMDSGASGPDIPNKAFLFAADRIPVADVVAVLGRIQNVESIADWRNLPSATRGEIAGSTPPMWLPRKAFKVNIRKAPFIGWPTDPKTGLPVGGEELKRAEERRVSKKDAVIGDAALDAVFDSWAWGASIATPDKVGNTLALFKPTATQVDLDAFVAAAIRGRSNTAFAAITFISIQILAFGTLFVGPGLKMFFNVDF